MRALLQTEGGPHKTVDIVRALNIFHTYEKALPALLNVHVAEHFADKEISLGIPISVAQFDFVLWLTYPGLQPKDTAIIFRWAGLRFKMCVCVHM